jgi:hypothetical protein
MVVLRQEDLINNTVYRTFHNKNVYIFLFIEGEHSQHYIWCGSYYNKKEDGKLINNRAFTEYEQASPIEAAHLMECIRLNKYVSIDNIKIFHDLWI